MTDLHDLTYSQQKAFLGYFAEHFMNTSIVPVDSRPIAVLNRQEQESMALARRGLKMAINDCVSMTEGLRGEELAVIDAKLRAAGQLDAAAVQCGYGKAQQIVAAAMGYQTLASLQVTSDPSDLAYAARRETARLLLQQRATGRIADKKRPDLWCPIKSACEPSCRTNAKKAEDAHRQELVEAALRSQIPLAEQRGHERDARPSSAAADQETKGSQKRRPTRPSLDYLLSRVKTGGA